MIISPLPVVPDKALGAIRIILGSLMIYHGQEVFHREIMEGYLQWDVFSGQSAALAVYAGKSAELAAGIMMLLGMLTRVAAILLVGTFSYITFFVGGGRFWYEDQHPFMFVLFGLLYLFLGPGSWSLDRTLFGRRGSPE